MSSASSARDRLVMEPPRRPKRRLLSGLNSHDVLKKQRVYPPFPSPLEIINDSGTVECALFSYILTSTYRSGGILLADHLIDHASVSRNHCKIYASVYNFVSFDLSLRSCSMTVPGKNGLLWNDHRIRSGASIILLHNDTIKIETADTHRKFTCYHLKPPPGQTKKEMLLLDTDVKSPGLAPFVIKPHVLGDGAHATVRLAVDSLTHRQVACKSIRVAGGNEDIMKEVEILGALKHPNINGILHHASTPRTLYMFLELCTGSDLHVWLSARTTPSEPESKYIAYQLMRGLAYLHENDIAHRDLKPENVLLKTPGRFPRVLIADFGFSRSSDMNCRHAIVGTPAYMAPEAVRSAFDGRSFDDFIADYWSFGVVLFEILAAFRPFDIYEKGSEASWIASDDGAGQSGSFNASAEGPRTHVDGRSSFESVDVHEPAHFSTPRSRQSMKVDPDLARRIVHEEPTYDPDVWSSMPSAHHLVSGLLRKSPTLRYTIFQALECAWITEHSDILQQRYQKHVSGPFYESSAVSRVTA
ncbi:hypothetical protein BS47DRAFT_1485885 [Hydnum rufescens UP504]|uniref:non-specific serine/threonine protein kinase n=1 Tax=Hydnum rufescens UP504 TaxID=1448309 RepID=A0A9P6DTB7_9AGAM|nr:hypothetical protein BS47DRAFT_1485885 [Hydnum rufescens UP504]